MAVLVGIDEAGYGPILGPLVVSSVSFSVPDELLGSDMWQILSRAVGKRKSKLAGRVLITDSKKAYSKSAGIGNLRKTVHAALLCLAAAPEQNPSTAGELFEILCPSYRQRLNGYPWYQGFEQRDLGGDSGDIEIAAAVLKNTLSACNIELVDMSACFLDVGCYNRMVSAVNNKASVLFTTISGLIKRAFDNATAGDNLQIIVDRQSGRVSYRKILSRMFETLDLKIIRQDRSISSYELTGRGKKMRIHFPTKADAKYLPVSLASMTSKYVRQILVGAINHYFLTHCDHLKPTAGYWKDGLRFIKDIEQHLPDLQYDRTKLIRSR